MKLKRFWYKTTHWETWHYLAKYLPLVPFWAWYCLRARSLWFFTASNPTITFGGMEGETKKEIYDQLPGHLYPKSIYIESGAFFKEVKEQLVASGLTYPLAVKPDVGMMGFMFRTIRNQIELEAYHQLMPSKYIIQQFIDYPLEVSVFYYRFPGKPSGTVTGFVKKEFMQVVGDGSSTLGELIAGYERATLRLGELRAKHADRLNEVIAAGKPYILSHALNLSRGGKLVSLEHEKDERLLQVFDDLAVHANQFYYGRYDIRCASLEALKNGKDFSILEYNGCGAEPHHIYGNGNNLLAAYRIVLQHWKVLYQISSVNHRNGTPYWSYRRGKNFLKSVKKYFRTLKALDLETQI